MTIQSSLERGFESVVEKTGGIQGCMTAAGITLERPFAEHTWDESQRLLSVNFISTF